MTPAMIQKEDKRRANVMRRKVKKKPAPSPGPDALSLGDAIAALVEGSGHGGLSQMAETLGMTPSALRKRLQRPGAGFDEPTLRAAVLVIQQKARPGQESESNSRVGNFIIHIHKEGLPTWENALQ